MKITVFPDGRLNANGRDYRCALGPAGVLADKREGDGATPAGVFPVRTVLYRPDRLGPPETKLATRAMAPDDGWCDDAADPAYNRPVTLPYPSSAEQMWRDDHVYDICVVIGHNDDPPVPGKGSCIFFHLAREDYAPTEGCVAVSLPDMLEILSVCEETTEMDIRAP